MISVLPVMGLPEVRPGDEIADLILECAQVEDGDVVVVTQKIVSKAEGRLEQVVDDDDRLRLIERESVRILRRRGDLIISETKHGFVCANAGIDRVGQPGDYATPNSNQPRDATPRRSALVKANSVYDVLTHRVASALRSGQVAREGTNYHFVVS